MKVLFLPVNIASMQPLTAHNLNQIEGVEAKCLTYLHHQYIDTSDVTIYCPRSCNINNPWKWIKTKLYYRKKVRELIDWADVLHYVWGSALKTYEDLVWAKKMNKKVFIEFVGSEIRYPEALIPINKYYKEAFINGYEYKEMEKKTNSERLQKKFASIGAETIVNPEMQIFINQNLFTSINQVFFRLNIKDFIPVYPKMENKRLLIVHSPSALIAKGTNIILPTIKKLQQTYDFDFILNHNKPRIEALANVQKADIFIDQIILGTYAMAAMEAMAFGKPTLSYIMPEVFKNGLPIECPIVNANPDNLEEKLIELITNPTLRHETGKKSRVYVEKYHNVEIIAKQLLEIYKS